MKTYAEKRSVTDKNAQADFLKMLPCPILSTRVSRLSITPLSAKNPDCARVSACGTGFRGVK